MLRRLAHLIWGAEVDRALRPVLLVTLMGSLAGSSAWSFMGIWAVRDLGATSAQLSYGFLMMAVVGGLVGYVAGHLSDHFGRRRLILVVLVLFVIGEMLWVPTSQSIVAGLAPDDLRGAYMGAFGGTGAMGFALAPFLGLQVRSAAGDMAMWAAFASVALVGAVLGAIACRGALGRRTDAAGSAVLDA